MREYPSGHCKAGDMFKGSLIVEVNVSMGCPVIGGYSGDRAVRVVPEKLWIE